MGWLSETPAGIVIQVRVVPRASRDGVAGLLDDAVKIRLQAPPVEGKANKALLRFLADALDLPARRVSLLAGDQSRHKRILLAGIDAAAVRQGLGV